MLLSERHLKILGRLKVLVRLAMKLSIVFMIISICLVFFLREKAMDLDAPTVVTTIIWCSIIGGIWVATASFIILLLIAVIHKVEKSLTWALFKTDVFLLLGLVACFGIFYLTVWWVFEIYGSDLIR